MREAVLVKPKALVWITGMTHLPGHRIIKAFNHNLPRCGVAVRGNGRRAKSDSAEHHLPTCFEPANDAPANFSQTHNSGIANRLELAPGHKALCMPWDQALVEAFYGAIDAFYKPRCRIRFDPREDLPLPENPRRSFRGSIHEIYPSRASSRQFRGPSQPQITGSCKP